MYRNKRRFYQSILFRISFRILALGLAGMLSVTWFVRIQMRYQIEKQITEELLRVRDNFLLYVQQTLLLNDGRMNAADFEVCREEIREQLDGAGYRDILLCAPDGRLLAGDEDVYEMRRTQEDFKLAGEQESAITIRYGNDDLCQVYFSVPVILKGQFLGRISSFFDYGELYGGQLDTIERMIWITVAVFGLICLIIWVTVYRIVSPVRDLSRAVDDTAIHLADGLQDSMILGRLQFQGRRDEIGELTTNYLEMLHVIEEQFRKIQEDKERILTLWHSRQEFYNNVTHELKTPLTTISGYAQLMEKNGPEDEGLFHTATEHILKESTRLYRMVVQLLELQDKVNVEEMRRLDLAEILKDVAESMEIKAGRYENKLLLEGAEGFFYVTGREDKIRQVLINLIDNAIKYGEPQKPIRIRIAEKEGQIQITVANEGQGIRPEELETIFEPFYRADKGLSRELGSSGLGLSIAAKIMREHGGHIAAASVPGGETVFTVSFPGKVRRE